MAGVCPKPGTEPSQEELVTTQKPAYSSFTHYRNEIRRILGDHTTLTGSDIDLCKTFRELLPDDHRRGDFLTRLGEATDRRLFAPLMDTYESPEALALHLAETEPVAVVGMGARFPGAQHLDTYWSLLKDGKDAVSDGGERWDMSKIYDPDRTKPGRIVTRKGGFLKDLDKMDADFFDVTPREAAQMDPRQRLMLELAWESLEDAGIPPLDLAGTKTGVYVATLTNDYEQMLFDDLTRVDAYSSTGTAHSITANRISYCLDLQGPSIVVDTACSGSLVAVDMALRALRRGDIHTALVGGVMLNLLPNITVFFSKAGALNADGRCRTFDENAGGIVRGEGAGLIVLKPLHQAKADGNPIYGLIRGASVNNDGKTRGIMQPNGKAQEDMLAAALEDADLPSEMLQYIEAHGTGTPVGDPIEVNAIGNVLARGGSREHRVGLGSVKTNLGHLESAAGMAGLIKVLLAMKHRVIPATIHFDAPNPKLNLDQHQLQIIHDLSPWPVPEQPLFAGVSSFGYGGTNAHVILEEPPVASNTQIEAGSPTEKQHFLPLSARSTEALQELATRILETLEGDQIRVEDLTYTASIGRSHLSERLWIHGRDRQELISALKAFAAGEVHPRATRGKAAESKRRVFVFSGQGSHWLNMGKELYQRETLYRETFQKTVALFAELGLEDLQQTIFGSDESKLNQTRYTQPAIFTAQVSLLALWRSWGVDADAVVGHSLGEIAAAHAAGILSLEDAAKVVFHRARLMAQTEGKGATAVVGLTMAELEDRLQDRAVWVAGCNSHENTVVAGEAEALDVFLAELEAQDIYAQRLRGVDIPFHCPLMDPIRGELEASLADIQPQAGKLPFYAAVEGGRVSGDTMDARYWGRNLRDPFLFAQVFETLLEDGFRQFIEVSAHPVLLRPMTGAAGNGLGIEVLPSLRRGNDEQIYSSLGEWYCNGGTPDWSQLQPQGHKMAKLPTYPWQRRYYWLDQLKGSGSTQKAGLFKNKDAGQNAEHPLLGRPFESAGTPRRIFWQGRYTIHDPAFLADHRVFGSVVVPGATYVTMGMEAMRFAGHELADVEHFHFNQFLFLEEDKPRLIQASLEEGEDQTWNFKVFSSAVDENGSPAKWEQHAQGVLKPAGENDHSRPGRSLSLLREQLNASYSAEQHYASMLNRGLEYGPCFEVLKEIRSAGDEALGALYLPKPLSHELNLYTIHPVLIDAAFQVLEHTLPELGALYLPAELGNMRFYKQAGGELYSHVRLTQPPSEESPKIVGDIIFLDETGELIAECENATFAKVEEQRAADYTNHLAYHLGQVAVEEPPQDQASGHWLILGDYQGTGQKLADVLMSQGATVDLVLGFSQTNMAHTLAEKLNDVLSHHLSAKVVSTLSFDSVAADTELNENNLIDGIVPAFSNPVRILQTLLPLSAEKDLRFFILNDPNQSAVNGCLEGLAAVARQEHPELWGGLININTELSETRLQTIISLMETKQAGYISVEEDGIHQPQLLPFNRLEEKADAYEFNPEKAYLITGGFGGLGLMVARWMIAQGARKLVLLSRSGLPARETWDQEQKASTADRIQAVRELEGMGAQITAGAVDMGDGEGLRAFRQSYLAEGGAPIAGILHAAGLVRDQAIANIDDESVAAVMGPKLLGSINLAETFGQDNLDFLVFFSSTAAQVPVEGQSTYAAANAFMDAYGRRLRARNIPAISINWGAWGGAGLAVQHGIEDKLRFRGYLMMDPNRALASLAGILAADLHQLTVAQVDWTRWQKSNPGGQDPFVGQLQQADSDGNAGEELLFELLSLDSQEERIELLVSRLKQAVAGVMGMEADRIDANIGLTNMGLDSIMAVDLRNNLEQAMGISLSIFEMLRGPSPRELAEKLMEKLLEDALGSSEEALAEALELDGAE